MKYLTILLQITCLSFLGCKETVKQFDATGTFEANELIISAEANGKILSFDVEEGDELNKGQVVAKIEPINIELQKEQLQASIQSLGQKKTNAGPQIKVLEQQLIASKAQVDGFKTQLAVLQKEQIRIQKLYAAEAATEQSLDNINGKVEVLQKQIETAETQKSIINAQIQSAKESVALINRSIGSEQKPLEKKMDLLEDMIRRTTVVNPMNGRMLSKYAYAGELAGVGKPLYKLADLSKMTLRAYITGDQLAKVELGQTVSVYVDTSAEEYKTYDGKIMWISDQAEFTPKTIQTKDERANLVYAIKIAIANDGFLKIGMYGELRFDKMEN